jgi:hypothetical protein
VLQLFAFRYDSFFPVPSFPLPFHRVRLEGRCVDAYQPHNPQGCISPVERATCVTQICCRCNDTGDILATICHPQAFSVSVQNIQDDVSLGKSRLISPNQRSYLL